MNYRLELVLTFTAFLVSAVAGTLYLVETSRVSIESLHIGDWRALGEHSVFLVITLLITTGAFIYYLTRWGFITRRQGHEPVSQAEMDRFLFSGPKPPVQFLVPSYREETRVIWQTLISAALQEYPNRRVTLLIDDPPNPSNPQDVAMLENARELVTKLDQMLREQADLWCAEAISFRYRLRAGQVTYDEELQRLASHFEAVAEWFGKLHDQTPERDHTDRLFKREVLAAKKTQYSSHAHALLNRETVVDMAMLEWEYRRLESIFCSPVSSFERKRYLNLSHAPNKAMNLNAYVDLIGKYLRERETADGVLLEEVDAGQAGLHIPHSTYVATLDADSILLPGYVAKLVYFLEQPDNQNVAVAQTPYSAIPGASSATERIAGATTDIQYLVHQGFTRYNGTYWVGANAMLRLEALKDIRTETQERGWTVSIYVQDRTVIEDTESTIDLVSLGWRLFNYPERLAYSATPSDFGSLLIQRRRWANGGLIIMPKLLLYLARQVTKPHFIFESMVRTHYLVSITLVNFGLPILLFYPFEEPINSFWLPLTAIPYFFLYGRDLRQAGYRWTDLPKVYALNLMLIPVNIGGVLKSIEQAIRRHKIAFGRTPKVLGRTASPATYILIEFGMVGFIVWACAWDLASGRFIHGAFSLVNGLLLGYAVFAFMGVRTSFEDLATIVPRRLRTSLGTNRN